MKQSMHLPSVKESFIVIGIFLVYLLLTSVYIGLRPEHLILTGLFFILFFTGLSTRKLAVALLPFLIFGMSYDWMRVCPNYEVNPIDVSGLYHLEESLFGIMDKGVLMIPSKYFVIHHWAVADFFAGVFYLCWVPVPIAFGLWLFFTKSHSVYLRFSMTFLLVNLIGFVIYYIHPAAPPWYALKYGFQPILNTPGNMGGLSHFDDMTGLSVFASIYGRNANVFAAIPSLHSSYMVVTLAYAIVRKCKWPVITLFTIIMLGIWGTAVYTSQHYIIDVLLGISCALVGIFLFEVILMRLPAFHRFFEEYDNYIK
ncbi:MAG: phosphatase PAP2 family protein [Bacteroidaceae bacterium]|nr:phosphatase PAP2 family protein [Bacteroidaceae bacterium]